MRKTAFTIMIVLLLLSCAGNNDTKRLLSRAENMLNEHPDSCYALLEGVRTQSVDFSESDRMRYNLLLAYSMAKNGIPLDTFMSIRDIVDYYDMWGNSHDKMIANYMLGNVYKDKGDTPMALQYFRDAVGHADTTKTDCDFRTLSRIYGQMAVLFHSQRSPKLELEMERKAERYANIAKDSISAVIFYAHTADAYHLLGNEDSVLHIFTEAAKRYIKLGHKDFAASTKSTLMEIYMKRGDYEKAKKAMDEYEQFSGFFNEEGEIEQGREIYYSIKGDYYYGIGKIDSAEYFYRKLLHFQSDIGNIENGYKGLMEVYQTLNVPDSMVKYAKLFAQMNDSACLLSSSEEINRMQALYNYNESRRIVGQKTKELTNYKILIGIIVSVFIVLMYIIYRYIQEQRKLKEKEMLEINTKYSDTLFKYKELQIVKENIEKGFEYYKIKNEQEIEKLKRILTTYQGNGLQPEK